MVHWLIYYSIFWWEGYTHTIEGQAESVISKEASAVDFHGMLLL